MLMWACMNSEQARWVKTVKVQLRIAKSYLDQTVGCLQGWLCKVIAIDWVTCRLTRVKDLRVFYLSWLNVQSGCHKSQNIEASGTCVIRWIENWNLGSTGRYFATWERHSAPIALFVTSMIMGFYLLFPLSTKRDQRMQATNRKTNGTDSSETYNPTRPSFYNRRIQMAFRIWFIWQSIFH